MIFALMLRRSCELQLIRVGMIFQLSQNHCSAVSISEIDPPLDSVSGVPVPAVPVACDA
jgi:hypothetical protein